jgi:subtilisin family serine protease
VTVAVLDTGIAKETPFPVVADPGDVEPVVEQPVGHLGPAVGHGTFVAGIVSRTAPGATLVVRRVLGGPDGVADELEVAAKLLDLPAADVVNMSFGGFAVDDQTMLAFERAVNTLPRTTLVVAAAGNHGVVRPFFPAAFKRVLAVGSVERRGSRWRRAPYSNFGPWVDAASPGTDVHSTFVRFAGAETFEGGALWSGTSFAAPHVSGAAVAAAARDGIPVRLAAHQLLHEGTGTVVADVGRLIP